MTIQQQIGTIIKEKRKAKKLTQKQLCVLAFGTDEKQSWLSKAEKGLLENIGFEEIYNVFKIYKIDLLKLSKTK